MYVMYTFLTNVNVSRRLCGLWLWDRSLKSIFFTKNYSFKTEEPQATESSRIFGYLVTAIAKNISNVPTYFYDTNALKHIISFMYLVFDIR